MKKILSNKIFLVTLGVAVVLLSGVLFVVIKSDSAKESSSSSIEGQTTSSTTQSVLPATTLSALGTGGADSPQNTNNDNEATGVRPSDGVPIVIFDTDMGTDIDDAVALAILHGYEKEGKIQMGAVVASRADDTVLRYSDVLNTYYGQPDIPLGKARSSASQHTDNSQYAGDQDILSKYPNNIENQEVREGVDLYRKILAESPDNSVIVVHVGFIETLDLLLDSKADEFSELNGVDLVAKKVQRLAIMGGNVNVIDTTGFNFKFLSRPDSLKTTLDKWPVEILQIQEPFGREIPYPDSAMSDDDGTNPLKESYNKWKPQQNWHTLPNAMRAPDPATSIAGIEPGLFDKGNPGKLFAQGPTNQNTGFREEADGKHFVLSFAGSAEEQAAIDRMVELSSFTP